MEGRRLTQQDIARIAGVHRATVSLVFRDHPSIPETTKRRIRKIAEDIGYKPDPYLSGLSAYRTRLHSRTFQGTLVWLVNNKADFDWLNMPVYRGFFEGAKSRAPRHGYQLEVVPMHSPDMTASRLSGIFRSRNISGLLLCPQPGINTELIFPWEHYSCVALGYSLSKPQFHAVVTSQYKAMLTMLRTMKEMGYKRIGYVYAPDLHERTEFNSLAGFLVESLAVNQIPPPLPMLGEPYRENPRLFLDWFRKTGVDAIVTTDIYILKVLEACGLEAPRDLGVAAVSVPSSESALSGVYENPVHIGEAAVDFLVAMLHRGERGIPAIPQRLHIQGSWIPGKTLAQQ